MLPLILFVYVSLATSQEATTDAVRTTRPLPEKIRPDAVMAQLANSSYDPRVRPPNRSAEGKNRGIDIYVDMYLRSLSTIDFVNMQYSLQMTFRETWRDTRLAYSHMGERVPKFIIITKANMIWMPDTFFSNEKTAHRHMLDSPNMLIRVHPDGTVLYSERISLVVSCPMYLQKYPMDVQTCHLNLASYAYTDEDIVYHWKPFDSIQFHPQLNNSLPSYHLTSVDTSTTTHRTNTGAYSGLMTTFVMARQFSYYLVQVYMPSSLLVMVSWVSFWLDRSAVPARVTLGVTTLLTMTTQAASVGSDSSAPHLHDDSLHQAAAINAKLPPVSYVKAIDIWIGVCLCFIFAGVLEFAWVSFVASTLIPQREKEREKAKCGAHKNGNGTEAEALLEAAEKEKKNSGWRRWLHNPDPALRIDMRSRIIFPVCWTIFNILYWGGFYFF